ncbi:MAG TPA: L-seryl-tRNA(Sec) selenium transferase [Candidatus Marinimicrobia bacterium]|nr:L-seryl-tRNA(Sec) selenium transferase [Candidatus Neomarinimicrobiota bacterium]
MADHIWRKIPSVNILKEKLLEIFPNIIPEFAVWFIQEFLFDLKKGKNLSIKPDFSETDLVRALADAFRKIIHGTLEPVINGTGIVLHTGLGRAPLDEYLLNSAVNILKGYLLLEFDINSGARGERNFHNGHLLRFLTGAEDHAVVNNNAAAVLLSLCALGGDASETIVSRGQLVEIGGAFRIPDVMKQSGTIMVEVGTTNRTHLRDYRLAISPRTRIIFAAHSSNYCIQGFTAQPSLRELADLAHQHGLLLIYDLGSGMLKDLSAQNINGEHRVREVMEAGVDICTFSGDKLLGGPQAGIIAGKRIAMKKILAHPLMRAVRCDKVIFTLLQETLIQYVKNGAPMILTHRLLEQSTETLKSRGEAILSAIPTEFRENLDLLERFVEAGSGSAPLQQIPSMAIRFSGHDAKTIADRFRKDVQPPVIGYIHKDTYYIDLRAILPNQIQVLAAHITKILKGYLNDDSNYSL